MFEPIRQYVRQVRRTFYQHEDPPATPFLSMIHYMWYACTAKRTPNCLTESPMRSIIGFWPAAAHQTGPTVYHPAAGRAYRLYNVYVYVGITVTAVTIVLDLVRAETRGSAKLIADDLTMCCGALIVLFKACSFRHHHAAIVRLFVRLERCYRDQCASSRDWRMLRVRRLYYLQDFAIQVISTALMALMYAGFTLQPFFRDDKALMYRAMLPWDTSATEAGYRAGCLMQLVNSTVVLPCILGMECCGVLVVNQVTMHLHLLRIKWEGLGEDRSGALRADRPFRRFMERRVGELVAEHQMIIEYGLAAGLIFPAKYCILFIWQAHRRHSRHFPAHVPGAGVRQHLHDLHIGPQHSAHHSR